MSTAILPLDDPATGSSSRVTVSVMTVLDAVLLEDDLGLSRQASGSDIKTWNSRLCELVRPLSTYRSVVCPRTVRSARRRRGRSLCARMERECI